MRCRRNHPPWSGSSESWWAVCIQSMWSTAHARSYAYTPHSYLLKENKHEYRGAVISCTPFPKCLGCLIKQASIPMRPGRRRHIIIISNYDLIVFVSRKLQIVCHERRCHCLGGFHATCRSCTDCSPVEKTPDRALTQTFNIPVSARGSIMYTEKEINGCFIMREENCICVPKQTKKKTDF